MTAITAPPDTGSTGRPLSVRLASVSKVVFLAVALAVGGQIGG